MTTNLIAFSKKNQSLVNKALYWGAKYNTLNDARDVADNDGEERLYRSLDNKCANTFDKYLDYYDALPKREQKRIDKILF
jgi:hypothetical protein